ncbi:PC4 and SFRS1-interacting protein [Achroia grisella]|uniref:PC4 and SFRS1-interacting protein n=1 Tax=Achroia grisella TaxID=688607 RepID=UPI0027D1FF8C|nr:PC4 and SFRS1-interacting protein [Achroia grisella]
MGKKIREYKSGDFIFAKVKGYPAWPARVQRPNGKKYFVYFYGTGETANLPPNMIFDYAENKDKFLTKTVKRRDFNDGVKQIEYDFANNVPLEDVIGVPLEGVADTSANDTGNETGNDTLDDTVADTTAADDTVADDSTANVTQNDGGIEDSDEAGALIIDEGNKEKKGRKSNAKPAKETPAKPIKEPKTPRGKAKKEETKEEDKDDEKKEEEIVSRSGRKIRPKRYIDEQTDENSTLPSPAPKKRRGASPPVEKEKEKEESVKEKSVEKNLKQYHTISQSDLENLKEPFKQEDTEKDNILITYLPTGQYVGIKLFQSRPTSFKNESSRLQWDKQAASNAVTLKLQLERGQIKPESILAQLVMELNLSDEEKSTLDNERETDEKKSRVQFLKTEMKLIELDAKIKTCLCLEKADTELCLKLLDELMELEVKPLMLLKHPTCLETVKRMRAYVGNTPSWDLSESAALVFSKQAHRIRKQADTLYKNMKELFITPDGLSFWEYFSERVIQFKKITSKFSADELLEMVHEPLELSLPTAHTMKAAIDAANDEELKDGEEVNDKKKSTPVKPKKTANNSTPAKTATKRQSSRKLQDDKDTNAKKETNAKKDTVEEEEAIEKTDTPNDILKEAEKPEENNKDAEPMEVDNVNETAEEVNSLKENSSDDKSVKEKNPKEKNAEDKSTKEKKNSEDKSTKEKKDKNSDEKGSKEKKEKTSEDKSTKDKKDKNSDDKSINEKSPEDKSTKEKNSVEKSPSPVEKEKESDKGKDDEAKEDKAESKEDKEKEKDVGEPRAKRSRETKKTEPPPPRSPAKRKAKV